MVSTLKLPVGIEKIVKRNLRYCSHATIPRGVFGMNMQKSRDIQAKNSIAAGNLE